MKGSSTAMFFACGDDDHSDNSDNEPLPPLVDSSDDEGRLGDAASKRRRLHRPAAPHHEESDSEESMASQPSCCKIGGSFVWCPTCCMFVRWKRRLAERGVGVRGVGSTSHDKQSGITNKS